MEIKVSVISKEDNIIQEIKTVTYEEYTLQETDTTYEMWSSIADKVGDYFV